MRRHLPAALPLFLLATGAHAGFPEPYDSQKDDGRRMPAEQVAAQWKVPEGFGVSVFAAEPDVRQPIAACWDAQGRLWVAENYTYAQAGLEFDLNLNDRILIFEDTDLDGRHDRRTVFADDLKMLTSVEIGDGGVYVLCPPRLLWIPVLDDRPAGPPITLLDGFETVKGNRHTFANGLKWGPDGWLYGRVGISSPCRIGPPGQPDERRERINGGIWRYHPRGRIVEAVCHGTTNPWGLDWDEDGEGFFTNTVIGHLWHLLPGAHFKRMHGEDVNPRCYAFIDQIADHYHFDTGKGWTSSRDAGHGADALGGGHAHCGALIYKGANWPAAWRGKLLTLNLHGRRINVERLERHGATYVGRHEPDAFFCPDPWFRGIDLLEGPDGGVLVLDWSDTGECHDHDGVHRGSGRIYKITHGRPAPPDWTAWRARHAFKRLPTSAAPTASPPPETSHSLAARRLFRLDAPGEMERLRAVASMIDAHPGAGAEVIGPALLQRVPQESSGLVLGRIASFMRKAAPSDARALAEALMAHPEVNADPVLRLLVWQQMEPVVARDLRGWESRFASAGPEIRRWLARRLAEAEAVAPLLGSSASWPLPVKLDLALGLDLAWQGRRNLRPPAGWEVFAGSLPSGGSGGPEVAQLQKLLPRLAARFEGGGGSLDEFRALARDGKADPLVRRQALQSLVDARADGLHDLCKNLLGDSAVAPVAARGLALSDDPGVGPLLASRYKWSSTAKPVFLEVLASRPAWALALLEAIGKGDIAAGDLPVFLARQIAALPDDRVRARLREVWGEIRAERADLREKIADWKTRLAPEVLARADLRAGRAVYEQTCAACHVLYGAGGVLGPDLTGGGRRDLDYLLENVVDPSAVVAHEHRVSVVTLKDGRVLSGALARRDAPVLELRTLTGLERLDRQDVAGIQDLPQSLMPEGLLDALSAEQARDLVAYLMHDRQVE
jgi:putative membrane-bound dehydrogenase-like protein